MLGPSCVRDKVSEYFHVFIIDRLEDFGHGCIVGMPRPRLVLPECLEEIILALVCESRHVFLSGKIGSMADIAVVCSASALPRARRCGSPFSASGLGGGSLDSAMDILCRSSSLHPFVFSFIGGATRSRSRNIKSRREMGHPGFAIGHPRHGRTDRLAVAARPLSRLEHKRQAK